MMLNELAREIHADNVAAGWWNDIHTGESILETRNKGEMFMLFVTELAEAFEGIRKNQMDKHLPDRTAEEVELADLFIRVLDYAGARGLDLDGAIADKRAYNKVRADHKVENRKAAGGKAF